ncbi:acyl-CoA dehydrogenase [Staphylococcus pseudintermedius]|nr:acyl-CoA dehydrogenase [Staphylococcus pseudintermedius]
MDCFDSIKKDLYKNKDKLKSLSIYYDEINSYPHESIKILKEIQIFKRLFLKNNNVYFSIKQLEEILQIISSCCMSTGLICAMHFQQIITIIKHSKFKESVIIDQLLDPQLLIASVTSEVNKKSDIKKIRNNLNWIDENDFILNRKALAVTGGLYADAFLLTSKIESNSNKNIFVYFKKKEISVEKISQWEAMGVRPTQSDSLSFTGVLNKDKNLIFKQEYDYILNETFIPLAHIFWSACWLGCAKEALKETVRFVRKNSVKNTEINLFRLSESRRKIDIVNMYLDYVIKEYLNSKSINKNTLNIHINDLKIISSTYLFDAINNFIEITGMSIGYKKNNRIFLEKYFRDLRSGSLMYSNDGLIKINGKISLFDSDLLP